MTACGSRMPQRNSRNISEQGNHGNRTTECRTSWRTARSWKRGEKMKVGRAWTRSSGTRKTTESAGGPSTLSEWWPLAGTEGERKPTRSRVNGGRSPREIPSFNTGLPAEITTTTLPDDSHAVRDATPVWPFSSRLQDGDCPPPPDFPGHRLPGTDLRHRFASGCFRRLRTGNPVPDRDLECRLAGKPPHHPPD